MDHRLQRLTRVEERVSGVDGHDPLPVDALYLSLSSTGRLMMIPDLLTRTLSRPKHSSAADTQTPLKPTDGLVQRRARDAQLPNRCREIRAATIAASAFRSATCSARILGMIPALNRWRTFTVAGTSYPASVAAVVPPFQLVPRHEWAAYRMLVASLGSGARIPSFGDYAVAHHELVELDMRLIKPFAKLRYTTDDSWHIARGTPVRTHGFGQYRRLCADLAAQPYFRGRGYSAGDDYIADCAVGACNTGNLSTWVWVSSNRHMTKVVDDLATFHGLSAAA